MPQNEKSNKYLALVKNELGGKFDDLRINAAQTTAAASSSTFSWAIIGVIGFFTYLSFVLWAPLFVAYLYVKFYSAQGNAILVGYTAIFLLHLFVLLILLIFRRSLLQKKVYNKVFEAIFYLGEKK